MTQAQIKDAIEQMKVSCDLAMTDYRGLSARGCLYELGFHGEDCEAVLAALYAGGFTYCLDPHFPTKDGERPCADVCIWGPDQLKSRIQCVYIPTES